MAGTAARHFFRSLPLGLWFVFFCAAALPLAGCGYQLGADAPSLFNRNGTARELATLKIKEVENPTLFPWLNYTLRNHLRDEVNARNMAAWVDSGRADFEISIRVDHYNYRSWFHDEKDMPLLYEADITLEATLYKGGTNEVVWRSGLVTYRQTYETVNQTLAANEILQNLIRQLVDRMRQDF
jgi:hypothetical protein